MLVVYRCGTFGHYVKAETRAKYNWHTGNLAWSSCLPNECCWIVPGTVQPNDHMVRDYCELLEK